MPLCTTNKSSVKTKLYLRVLGKRFMEDLHVSIKYLDSVFPLNWVLFSKFGPQIEYQFSFISCLNKGQGLRPWAVRTCPKLMGAPPGANFVSTTNKPQIVNVSLPITFAAFQGIYNNIWLGHVCQTVCGAVYSQ